MSTFGFLDSAWHTARLDIADARQDEADMLRDLFNACSATRELDPSFAPTSLDDVAGMIARTAATRAGENERFTLQNIRLKETGELAGYYHVHYSLPRPEILWISMVAIHPDFQRRGIGSEMVHALAGHAAACGYASIWMKVYLKNLPALRCWTGAGFRTILEWRDEQDEHGAPVAALILERSL